jgi:hypothetical protein
MVAPLSATSRGRAVFAAIAGVFAIGASIAWAIDDAELYIESAEGSGWSAHGLTARVGLMEADQRAYLHIDALRVAELSDPIRDVRIDCPAVEISTKVIRCRGGRVSAQLARVGEQRLVADLLYHRADGSVDFDIKGLTVGAGTLALRGQWREEDWNVDARLQNASLDALLKLASYADLSLPLTIASGSITLDAHARGSGAQLASLQAKGRLSAFTANNESGSLATDALDLDLDTSLRRVGSEWAYDIGANAHAGQAYAEPIFLDFGAHSVDVSARGKFTESGAFVADAFSIDHANVMQASGTAALDFEDERPLRNLDFKLSKLQFPGAYESYMQPLLLETNFKSLRTQGVIAGRLDLQEGEPRSVELSLSDIDIDGSEALAIHALNGIWHWSGSLGAVGADDEADPSEEPTIERKVSQIRWSAGELYGLELGASSLTFTTEDRNFRLNESSRIPLLDGALQLDALRVRNAGLPSIAFIIDAVVQPISVQKLCETFGWPEFGGKVAGSISKLRMREGVLSLGTTLDAQVFDGEVSVSNLKMEEPFGKWPRFYSDIALRNLDLELLTGAFSFGRITGRLSGAISGLELFNWSPIAFDARLFTPPGDRSRHRISQRAVQNIGSIGGGGAGVTAALSSGFLRFFEDFNYARLGITCKLHNEVCEMSGVGPAPKGGYYLVQGRGLPRIDVIGNSRRVDWPRLVQQLIAATESGGPIVQ